MCELDDTVTEVQQMYFKANLEIEPGFTFSQRQFVWGRNSSLPVSISLHFKSMLSSLLVFPAMMPWLAGDQLEQLSKRTNISVEHISL